jgi:hypothetical protein
MKANGDNFSTDKEPEKLFVEESEQFVSGEKL